LKTPSPSVGLASLSMHRCRRYRRRLPVPASLPDRAWCQDPASRRRIRPPAVGIRPHITGLGHSPPHAAASTSICVNPPRSAAESRDPCSWREREVTRMEDKCRSGGREQRKVLRRERRSPREGGLG
jgi:hypothetical protein